MHLEGETERGAVEHLCLRTSHLQDTDKSFSSETYGLCTKGIVSHFSVMSFYDSGRYHTPQVQAPCQMTWVRSQDKEPILGLSLSSKPGIQALGLNSYLIWIFMTCLQIASTWAWLLLSFFLSGQSIRGGCTRNTWDLLLNVNYISFPVSITKTPP